MANSSPDNSTNDTSRPSSLPTPTTTMSDLILGLVAVEAACQGEAKTGKMRERAHYHQQGKDSWQIYFSTCRSRTRS
ncbi:hypothetical protein Pmani_004374 [Petrolisthes manimaculis]|uniref:Uncharacterized protein n=1 Tax=Petrolisthes manimaculis TaxID=1843537 RepID=A0AAE1QGZ6_9EUCA|nr:hypothetical protein Pmani_004374 [Petrolisthes manimaculis]